MISVEKDADLKKLSTLRIPGSARYLARPKNKAELTEALAAADKTGLPVRFIGGGTNIFFENGAQEAFFIKIEAAALSVSGTEYTAEAGLPLRLLVMRTIDDGCSGLQHLGWIPGTVGGAVRGNAGAYGTEIKDVLESATVFRRTSGVWRETEMSNEELGFEYRGSLLKKEPDIALFSAVFRARRGNAAEARAAMEEDGKKRMASQPYTASCIGSVFKNPGHGVYAGALIEEAGLKGLRRGGAEISPVHANFIVNAGGASAEDVRYLMDRAKEAVRAGKGIELEEEIAVY